MIPSRIDLEYVRRVVDGVDGSPFTEDRIKAMARSHQAELDSAYRGWAEANYELAVTKEALEEALGRAGSTEREDSLRARLRVAEMAQRVTQDSVERIGAERDRARRRATWWMLLAWGLFLVLVVGITWARSGR